MYHFATTILYNVVHWITPKKITNSPCIFMWSKATLAILLMLHRAFWYM